MKKLLSFVPAFAARALACHIFPLERLVRGWQVGPLMTKINSSPDQWAGRTTLDDGHGQHAHRQQRQPHLGARPEPRQRRVGHVQAR
jgi:hypothetical protein